MATTTATSKSLKDKLGNPKRLQVWIEEETYKKIHHAAIDRGEKGVSLLVEEALQEWLGKHGHDSAR